MMLGIASGIKQDEALGRRRPGLYRWLPAALAAALPSCGFHLAGTEPLPQVMQTTYLQTVAPHSDFYASLTEELRRRGLDLVDSVDAAGAEIVISQDSSDKRILSVSTRNIPREYEVYYAISFALRANGEDLIEPELIVARRSYTYDETQVLAKEREESQLRRALADDLARQVVRRIEALKSTAGPPG